LPSVISPSWQPQAATAQYRNLGHDTIPLLPDSFPTKNSEYVFLLISIATISANRIQKRSQRTTQKVSSESALSYYVSVCGSSSSIPYTNYFRRQRRYVTAPSSKRYSKCINGKVSYDRNNFTSALVRSMDELRALRKERRRL